MKNYTLKFLLVTIITGVLGFTGLEFPGDAVVRFIFLVACVGLFISCLDAVLVSNRMRKARLREYREELKKKM